jgi:hypothetical protein
MKIFYPLDQNNNFNFYEGVVLLHLSEQSTLKLRENHNRFIWTQLVSEELGSWACCPKFGGYMYDLTELAMNGQVCKEKVIEPYRTNHLSNHWFMDVYLETPTPENSKGNTLPNIIEFIEFCRHEYEHVHVCIEY